MPPSPAIPRVADIESALRRIARLHPQMDVPSFLACRLAVLLGRELTARLDAVLAPEELVELEYRLLVTLHSRDGTASPGELCAALTQSPANLTRVGDMLVKRGLVTRQPDPQDRRRIQIGLTRAGAQRVRSLLPRITGRVDRALAVFSARELRQFISYQKRFIAALDLLPPGNAPRRGQRRRVAR